MLNRILVVGLAVLLSVFALTLMYGDGPGSGKVIWSPASEHGVNTGDVPIIVAWAIGLVACAVLFKRTD